MKRPGPVAFCFHDPAPSGASIWLRDFLLAGGWPQNQTLAVLPGESPLEEPLTSAGIAVHRVRVRLGALSDAPPLERARMIVNRASMVGQYVALFRRERVRLVYANSTYQIAPMLAAKALGIPLIVHVHEGWRSGGTHGIKRWAVRNLAQGALFAARGGMELFGPPGSRARWEFSPNGVDASLSLLRNRREDIRAREGISANDFVFLFLGTLSRRKGVHDLLRAWPRLHKAHPRARLLVGGNIDEAEQDPAIRAFLSSPPDGANYLGFRRDAPELIAAADALVLPSYGEAMPISISEAMMIGTPVVARDVGDVVFQIGEGRGFLFEGRGAKPLLRAMREAITNPELASQRAEAAADFARDRLERRGQVEQVSTFIRELLD